MPAIIDHSDNLSISFSHLSQDLNLGVGKGQNTVQKENEINIFCHGGTIRFNSVVFPLVIYNPNSLKMG